MKKLFLIPAFALAGAACAALLITSSASAYTIDQLPNLGYSVIVDSGLGGGCHGYQAGYGNAPKTDLGSDCDPGFQGRVDALVNATCPCVQSTTTAPTTTASTTTPPTTTTGGGGSQPVTTTVVSSTTTTIAAGLPSAPIADFDGQAVNPNVVSFTDSTAIGGAAVLSRLWLFGDGTSGAGSPVTHVYAGPGTYYVALIVTDANGLGSVAAHQLTIAADHSVTLGPRQTQIVASPKAKPAKKAVTKKPAKKKVAAKKKPVTKKRAGAAYGTP